jgi:hypothetical protein
MPGAEPPAIRGYFSQEGSRDLRAASVTGGALATASLATSALTTVTLTTKSAEQDSSADTLYRLMSVTGGPVHGIGLGLLTGSLGLAGLRTSELPRRLSKARVLGRGRALPARTRRPGLLFTPLGRLSALAISAVAGVRLARANG